MSSTQESLQTCIEQCWACRHTCQTTLFNHCLHHGGKHVEVEHVCLMTDCMEICQTAADFMSRTSTMHASVCSACADICEACAQSCDAINDDKMRQCADACRLCAQSCRAMGKPMKKAA